MCSTGSDVPHRGTNESRQSRAVRRCEAPSMAGLLVPRDHGRNVLQLDVEMA